MSRLSSFRRSREESEPSTAVVTLPRRTRPNREALERRQRRQARKNGPKGQDKGADDGSRAHGWGRAEDPGAEQLPKLSFLDRRRADGTPLLLFVVLAVMTGVGLARVDSRIEILDVANEITELSEDQQRLLDRKRRLEAERAYLRRPRRVSETAALELGMQPAPPDRIQRIELLPPKPEGDPSDPQPTP